jgi:hypothetical protein
MKSERWLQILLGMVLLSLAGIGGVRGQTPASQPPEDPEIAALDVRAREFLDRVAQDQSQQAFKDLFSGNPLFDMGKPSDAMSSLIRKAAELKTNYGECLDLELVETKKVGSRLVILRYLYECERFPVVWHFVFYRPPPRRDALAQPLSPWHVISVRFDTELERLAR